MSTLPENCVSMDVSDVFFDADGVDINQVVSNHLKSQSKGIHFFL